MTIDFEELTVQNVSRHFGRRKALAGISFGARAGGILGLLGPNGAGKSTLLALLATLLQPSAGTIRYGNLAVVGDAARSDVSNGGAALRARIGMLGHDLYLYPELTAREVWRARCRGRGRWRARTCEIVGTRRRSRQQLLARHASTGRARARPYS